MLIALITVTRGFEMHHLNNENMGQLNNQCFRTYRTTKGLGKKKVLPYCEVLSI